MDDDFPEIEDDDKDEQEWDELELYIEDCGKVPLDSMCSLAGTEYCSFRCPFSDDLLG